MLPFSNINLITTYHHDEQRVSEYIYCLEQNLQNPVIENIIILEESPLPIQHDKIHTIHIDQRPTYSEIFSFCNKFLPASIVILANADIYYDSTLRHIQEVDLSGTMIALSRYEDPHHDRPIVGPNSQDTWILKTPINIKNADYTQGVMGCDGKIAYHASNSGYKVYNPCYTIKSYHFHNSQVRHYDPERLMPDPHYTSPHCSLLCPVYSSEININPGG